MVHTDYCYITMWEDGEIREVYLKRKNAEEKVIRILHENFVDYKDMSFERVKEICERFNYDPVNLGFGFLEYPIGDLIENLT